MARQVVLGVVAALFVGCAHGRYVWVQDFQSSDAGAPDAYRIQAGDLVAVTVWGQANLSGDIRIRPDGHATLPLLGDIAAAGLTPQDWADQIQRALATMVVDPKVTVTVREPKPPTVAVLGEVRRVGEYPLLQTDSLLELLARAGGMTEFASPDEIFVLRRRPDLVRIRFSYGDLVAGVPAALSFRMQTGDIVIVE